MNASIIINPTEDEPFINRFTDAVTGIFASGKEDYARSLNRLVKSMFAKDFIFQLTKELDYYKQKGKVDIDYTTNKPYMNSLVEILDYLDTDIPNNEVADVLKKLFFIPMFKEYLKDDAFLSIEYMRIVKKLSSGELMVLFTTYKYAEEQKDGSSWDADKWTRFIAERSTLKYNSLVEAHERNLVEQKLLTKRLFEDESGVTIGEHFRLTDLGYNLCRYIEKYDNSSKE